MDLHFVTNFSWENEEVIHGEINAALEIDGFQILPSDWGKDVEKMISILMWIALQNTCKSVNTSILPGDGKIYTTTSEDTACKMWVIASADA